MHADDDPVGAHLERPESPVRAVIQRARQLAEIEEILRKWAGAPLAQSLRVANERNDVLIVFVDSAAAFTQLRYRQQEIVQFLRQQLRTPDLTLEFKMNPRDSKRCMDRV